MKTIRLDIGGPKGNAWYIMGTVSNLCKLTGQTEADAKNICQGMRGDSFKKLGGKGNGYEELLRYYLQNFPFVELYSTVELVGLDPELYTFDENPEIFEL
jgi:hypothetical protein